MFSLQKNRIFQYILGIFYVLTIHSTTFANSVSVIENKNARFPFFTDISPEHKDFEAITYLHSHGMINGYNDKTFKADNTISRVESVKLLLKASNKNIYTTPHNTSIFQDIPSNQWFSDYIYTAKKIGVINAYGEGGTDKFNPTRTVNRAEAIKMILTVNNEYVPPAKTHEQWFLPYFQKANTLHIFTQQYTKANFNTLISRAGDSLTRGELATYMYRYIAQKNGDLQTQTTLKPKTMSADLLNTSSRFPITINAFFINGNLRLEWKNSPSHGITIIASQRKKNNHLISKSVYVKNNTKTFDTSFFQGFETGFITFTIKNTNTTLARFILPVYTKFTPYIAKTFSVNTNATTYQYAYPNKKITVQIDTTDPKDFSKYKAYVLNSSENIYEKPISAYNEKSLLVEFIPKKKDLYIIEITDESGLAKAIVPVTPYGFFPILPNNLDLLTINTPQNQKKDISPDQIISEINTLRKIHNLPLLTKKIELTSLAQIRARDMKKRHYLSHTTPEGLTVNDMRSDYSLTSPLSENIATHSKGSVFAAIGLEYSPTHRRTLLNPELQYIGIATETLENGERLVVEVFQNKVVTPSDIANGEQILYNLISTQFPTVNTDIILQNVAEDWSQIMAKRKSAQTEFSDGTSWKNILDHYHIHNSTEIFVLSHQTPEKIKHYFDTNPTILQKFFKNKISYGLSIKMDSLGRVYLTLIGSE